MFGRLGITKSRTDRGRDARGRDVWDRSRSRSSDHSGSILTFHRIRHQHVSVLAGLLLSENKPQEQIQPKKINCNSRTSSRTKSTKQISVTRVRNQFFISKQMPAKQLHVTMFLAGHDLPPCGGGGVAGHERFEMLAAGSECAVSEATMTSMT